MQIIQLKNTDIDTVIAKCIGVLEQDGILMAPTDTVYGLLVNAESKKAVENLISFKQRPPGKAISVFVKDISAMQDIVECDSKLDLLKTLLPGPYTSIFKSKGKTSSLLNNEEGGLGVRVVQYDFINSLLLAYNKSLTATSANLSGKPSVYSAENLLTTLNATQKEKIGLIVDVGQLPYNPPSTVIDYTKTDPIILRAATQENAKIYTSGSLQETTDIVKIILADLLSVQRDKAIVMLLHGELGSGKTTFVKAIGKLLGIQETIVSPTFVTTYEYQINSEYHSKNEKFTSPIPNDKRLMTNDLNFSTLHHFDLYNLEKESDIEMFNMQELSQDPGNIISIEWSEKATTYLQSFKTAEVFIEVMGDDERKFTVIV
jgi:L-threonylcarbamoyladenylate synthase